MPPEPVTPSQAINSTGGDSHANSEGRAAPLRGHQEGNGGHTLDDPELPANSKAEQVQAWAELAEMPLDPGFRAAVRLMAEHHAAEQIRSGMMGQRRKHCRSRP